MWSLKLSIAQPLAPTLPQSSRVKPKADLADFLGCHPCPHLRAECCLLQKPAEAISSRKLACVSKLHDAGMQQENPCFLTQTALLYGQQHLQAFTKKRPPLMEDCRAILMEGDDSWGLALPCTESSHPPTSVPKSHPAKEVGEDALQSPTQKKPPVPGTTKNAYFAGPWLKVDGCHFCCCTRALHQNKHRATCAGAWLSAGESIRCCHILRGR